MKNAIVLVLLNFVCAVMSAGAIMHRDSHERGPVEYVRPVFDLKRAHTMGYTNAALERLIQTPSGTKKIAVILVQFPSSGSNTTTTNTSYRISAADITDINTTVSYLKNFYYSCSYGKLILDPTFFYSGGNASSLTGSITPYTMPSSMSYYGASDTTGSGLESLVSDALAAVGSGVNYPAFDAVIVIHAGYGNESTNYAGDIWSAVTELSPRINQFSDAAVIPARQNGASTNGVICHEFGHVLGLPDLYNTQTGASNVGYWCLMDAGSWNNSGKDPLNPSVWCKAQLTWLTPVTIYASQQVTAIKQFETSPMAYKLPVLNNPNEYFLVCYSSKSAYNVIPPGEGFMIWHIDEGTIDNTTFSQRMSNNTVNNYGHLTVDLVPAGDTKPSDSPFGTAFDPWPGKKGTFTTPLSDSYDGRQSNISLSDFTSSGSAANMYVLRNVAMTESVTISKAINYPNPSGAGYASPSVMTTFVFNFTKDPGKKTLTIYTLAGELVKEVSGADIHSIPRRAADYKLVYEYDWDGRNNDNEPVAPGLYIYRIVADNAVKTGKLAVVR